MNVVVCVGYVSDTQLVDVRLKVDDRASTDGLMGSCRKTY